MRRASAQEGAGGSPATLSVSGVTVRFGGLVALDDVSLEATTGRVVGVIGPNGAGKTTLFNVVCGFVAPDSGTLTWRGAQLRRMRPHRLARLGIARTLQGVGLFPGLTVLENVMVGAGHRVRSRFVSSLLGLPPADRGEAELRAAAMEALEALGAADVAERMPASLPYAVQKRVALARALAARPELLLLDEPAGGLGAEQIGELAELIRGLRSSMGVMLVEHHMDLVMGVCDEVVVLDFGKVIARGTPAEVKADPRVMEAYLGVPATAEEPAAEAQGARG